MNIIFFICNIYSLYQVSVGRLFSTLNSSMLSDIRAEGDEDQHYR
jgi:hypothetical protein